MCPLYSFFTVPVMTSDSWWQRFPAAGRLERDPGFREVVDNITERGMVRSGWLAIGLVAVFVLGVALTTGIPIVMGYPEGGGRALVLWDKLIVITLGGTSILLARVPAAVGWGRSIVAVMVTVATASIVLDDAYHGDWHLRYVPLTMIATVGLMPYRPMQMLALCVSICLASVLSLSVFPSWLGFPPLAVRVEPFVFLALVTLVLTVVSATLYRTRFGQYAARRRAEELAGQVRIQAEDLRRIEAQKDQFFANLSHEFRTPLTLIMAPLDDALEGRWGRLRASAVNRITVMRRNARRLLTLINQLLELSRLDEGYARLAVAEQDLVAIGRLLVSSFSAKAERQSISLSLESDEERIDVFVDRDAIEKVLSNLLSNAIKFTPSGGSVRVRIDRSADGTARIAVRDTGAGIDPDDLVHVFDRFFQGRRGGGESDVGSGIGLALTAALVRQHGGDISVTSEKGFGSEFTVTLPPGREHLEDAADFLEHPPASRMPQGDGALSDDKEAVEVHPDEEEASAPGADSPMVLVVDDDPDVREYLRELLSDRYRVKLAEGGEAAIRSLEADRPDLVLSDVMMPDVDGLELCRWIRSQPAQAGIPVILLTALAEEDNRIEGLRERADDYICKPFSREELLVRVENLIEVRRVIREHTEFRHLAEPTEIEAPSADHLFLERVRSVVEEHMQDSNFTVEWLADEVHLSSKQVSRKLQKLTSLSAGGFIRMMRLKRAGQLLARHAGNVSEVAYAVGFNDAAHFSRLFKQTFGVTPSEFVASSADDV